MIDYKQLWTPRAIAEGRVLSVCLGASRVWIRRGAHDWLVASETEEGEEERCSVSIAEEDVAAERDWTRWILDDAVEQVRLRPRLPDRPIIVRPETPMCLMPKQSAQFYVGVPIWLSLTFGVKNEQAIDVPTTTLSNSWFGSLTEGELCYAVKTKARLRREDTRLVANHVIIPLEIRNASKEKLKFERLCLRPQYLDIYQGDTRLWTGRGRVSYRGEDNWSRIVYAGTAPDMDGAREKLSAAREPMRRGALLKTFDDFKQRIEIS